MQNKELLYDPIPREDVKSPPLKDNAPVDSRSTRLSDEPPAQDVKGMLDSLNFG